MGLHRVYVVGLADEARDRRRDHERLLCVYVGSTGKDALERFRDHLRGHKAGRRVVTRYGLHLRPELFEGLQQARWPASVDLERAHAERLRDAGFTVYTDGGWLDPLPKSHLKEFMLAELPPEQLGHLDAAIMSALANPHKPLSATQCAHVLWGSQGEQVAAWGMRDLPEYGRFAHVKHAEIRARVVSVGEAGFTVPAPEGASNALRPAPLPVTRVADSGVSEARRRRD